MGYYYANDIIEKLRTASQLIVFGAGNVANMVVECLQSEFYNLSIDYCMVSEVVSNPKQVGEIPVIDYTTAKRYVNESALILIAVAEKYLDTIKKRLFLNGYKNLLPLTFENDIWSLIRGNYYRNDRLMHEKPYLTMEEELHKVKFYGNAYPKTFRFYSARCHIDRELTEDISHYSWEIPIQVGADLAEKRICDICDNTGDHISKKNRQYCELTALYWIWKNDKSDFVGLGHYRRHFEIDEEQINQLTHSDIDVVLTIPIMDVPNVEVTYRRDHISADWDIMLEAVRQLSPNYLNTVKEMQSGKYYYAYNMFIMRREILENYCEWLFPILSYCEKHCDEKRDKYQNRFIGFLGEHLMSVYFMHHEKKYKIVHARKHFIY